MNPNPIQKIVWIFPVLMTALVGLNNKDQILTKPLSSLSITIYILIALALVLAILSDYISRGLQNLDYILKRVYSSFIYKDIYTKIEYLVDDGSLVSYYRHDHVEKLSLKKSKRMVKLTVEFDGEVLKDSVSTVNSAYTFPNQKAISFNSYIDEKNVLDRTHHGIYTLCVKNSFLGNVQFWMINTSKFCKNYNMEIIIPNTKRVIRAQLLEGLHNGTELNTLLNKKNLEWTNTANPKMLIIRGLNHTTISVALTGITPIQLFKVEWELN